jgi:hypothetical protein
MATRSSSHSSAGYWSHKDGKRVRVRHTAKEATVPRVRHLSGCVACWLLTLSQPIRGCAGLCDNDLLLPFDLVSVARSPET